MDPMGMIVVAFIFGFVLIEISILVSEGVRQKGITPKKQRQLEMYSLLATIAGWSLNIAAFWLTGLHFFGDNMPARMYVSILAGTIACVIEAMFDNLLLRPSREF